MTVAYDKLFRLMKNQKMTSTALRRRANISGNIISRLNRNEYVSLSTIESICNVFQCRVDDVLDFKFPCEKIVTPSLESLPLTADIRNRRYLGNKFKLLKFLREIVDEHCSEVETFADIFSGTGAVTSAFTDKTIITNDLLYSNYLCNLAWFGSEKVRLHLLQNFIAEYNRAEDLSANYMTENFADTYFSKRDCAKIGFVREDVEEKYRLGVINERERAILVASLIYAMDKIANTCGHYDAWRHGAPFERRLVLPVLNVPAENNRKNLCFNEDANKLIRRIRADLIYLDPPYNSRQYSDTYHLLENVACWQKPPVHGVTRKMNRAGLKSLYCTSKATDAFEDLIQHCHAKYILFSYNMANKGNARSNARIADEDIFRILNAKGDVEIFAKKYKSFTTVKSDIRRNEERLFLCKIT